MAGSGKFFCPRVVTAPLTISPRDIDLDARASDSTVFFLMTFASGDLLSLMADHVSINVSSATIRLNVFIPELSTRSAIFTWSRRNVLVDMRMASFNAICNFRAASFVVVVCRTVPYTAHPYLILEEIMAVAIFDLDRTLTKYATYTPFLIFAAFVRPTPLSVI